MQIKTNDLEIIGVTEGWQINLSHGRTLRFDRNECQHILAALKALRELVEVNPMFGFSVPCGFPPFPSGSVPSEEIEAALDR